ncbi:MAG: DUF1289 domain-containing protein [Rubrivivax sp.]
MTAGADAIASPCIGICRMDDARGLCEGCLRNLDEIALWSVLDDEDKRVVLRQIGQRRRSLPTGPGAAAPPVTD